MDSEGLSLRLSNNLNKLSSGYGKSLERLSSGLRVDSVEDGAADVGLVSNLKSQSQVFSQAVRNISEGISLASIADSALTEMDHILRKVTEYASRAEGSSLTDSERRSIQTEVDGLTTEYNRIVTTTQYNGISILSDQTQFKVQSGYGVSNNVAIDTYAQVNNGFKSKPNGLIERVTNSAGGEIPSDNTPFAMSADGRFIAFSTSTVLAASDTNGNTDIYIKDTLTGDVSHVSVDSAGMSGGGGATYGSSMSRNGRFISMSSGNTNFVSGDTNGMSDGFLYDRQTGEMVRFSVANDGSEGNNDSLGGDVSDDGNIIAFSSLATNMVASDTNGVRDIFIRNRASGTTTRITENLGVEANGASTLNQITPDGRYIIYSSTASNLIGSDTNGQSDIFVYDSNTGTNQRVNVSNSGAEANGASFLGSISDDGRFVSFRSDANNLVPGDANGVGDIFVKDLVTGEVQIASVSSGGTQGNAATIYGRLSGDGSKVVMSTTATNLVAGDTNGQSDAFVRDLKTQRTSILSVGLGGAQADSSTSPFNSPLISSDGRVGLFDSLASNLVSGDTNGNYDSFIVQINSAYDGGFSELTKISVDSQWAASRSMEKLTIHTEELALGRGMTAASLQRAEIALTNLSSAQTIMTSAYESVREIDAAEELANNLKLKIQTSLAGSVIQQHNLDTTRSAKLLTDL